MKRNARIGALFVAVFSILGFVQARTEKIAANQARGTVQAPTFQVDPMWPKPLPNHWILGSAIGVAVDAADHIWIIHRGASTLNNNEKAAELKPCFGSKPFTSCR